mmetsp:Transcript_40160/g.79135  ORF Transcript_40160/g.79135 Transcript_40160/m.79135 type:complete len:126 (+) Transcript_40160:278-655(+)
MLLRDGLITASTWCILIPLRVGGGKGRWKGLCSEEKLERKRKEKEIGSKKNGRGEAGLKFINTLTRAPIFPPSETKGSLHRGASFILVRGKLSSVPLPLTTAPSDKETSASLSVALFLSEPAFTS